MAKFCTSCGSPVTGDRKFCTECGTPLSDGGDSETQQTRYSPQTAQPPVPPVIQQSARTPRGYEEPPVSGSKYEPITTGGYLGILILMSIPFLGWLLSIIWACGGCRKVNKRNLARAYLILLTIGLVLSLILGFAVRTFLGDVASVIEREAGLSITENTMTNSDIQALEELKDVVDQLDGEEGSLSQFIEGAQDLNRQAEEANDGWPGTLRPYPNGIATSITSYRTEITGTSLEEMLDWIDDLRTDGFVFQDFYDFGFTEADMLNMNSWWATNGSIYISVSFADGTVTIDHTTQLPDLNGLLG